MIQSIVLWDDEKGTAEYKKNLALLIIDLSKQGLKANEIANHCKIKLGKVYYELDKYSKKNPQERAHITMRINKLGKENVSRKEGKVFKNVTTKKVLTYGVHSIILDDNTPRKIYLKANGDIHVE